MQLATVPGENCRQILTNPKVNLEVSAAAKLAIADLERDSHLVILVELFVEAFAHVGLHLDVVRRSQGQQAARNGEDSERREHHSGDWRGATLG
jgi:hypothetical protein